MRDSARASSAWPVIRGIAAAVLMTAIVAVLMMWLVGVFEPKIAAREESAPPGRPVGDAVVEAVARIQVPVVESSVGAIRPVHEVAIASKLLAKVASIDIRAGDRVEAGQMIVRLDDADLKARQLQAKAAVTAAEAVRDQARIEHERTKKLHEQDAAAQIELDRVTATLLSAEAEVQRARQQLDEAETILGYATIAAPFDGIVVDKLVESGDTVSPGQVLARMYDDKRMQLIASVRESLTHRLQVGQMVPVEIDALNLRCEGRVSEIVPEAESASRSFSVKVTGPCPEGVYPNMFGRLIIPLAEEEVLVIPRSAVRQVGQVDIVEVVEGDRLQRRAVQIGRAFDERVEVLSGLREGERVAVGASGKADGETRRGRDTGTRGRGDGETWASRGAGVPPAEPRSHQPLSRVANRSLEDGGQDARPPKEDGGQDAHPPKQDGGQDTRPSKDRGIRERA